MEGRISSTTVDPTATQRTLTYLADIPVDRVRGVGPAVSKKLGAQGIRSVAELLMAVPRRYLDRSQLSDIASAPEGTEVTIGGVVTSFSKRRISRGRTMVEARVSDGRSSVRVVWFNPYLTLEEGEEVALSGKIERYKGSPQMKSPAVDRLARVGTARTGRLLPIYGELGGLKPHTRNGVMENAVARSLPMVDPVPEEVLDLHDLVDRTFAFGQIHLPESMDAVAAARRRLIFDEFLRIQMAFRARAHDDYETRTGVVNSVRGPLFERYLAALPFALTDDQVSALEAILADMADVAPLHRLLQGEVGSGKTVVVIAALLTSVESGHQAAFMAPTEVLATQHYLGTLEALRESGMAPSAPTEASTGTASLFGGESLATRPVRIGLFTSGNVRVNFAEGPIAREQGIAWLADGTIDIAFGTHALIQPDITFSSLGIVVVDEQHRFGVDQRVSLRDRDHGEGVPDLLLMTATPIPRTFVMALYGDLDTSTIATMPPGRSPIQTEAVPLTEDADRIVDGIVADEARRGRSVFVVCPLVEDSSKIEARSAVAEQARLAEALDDVSVGLLHGQMTSDEKAEAMRRFRSGADRVLVATTVIEVGIDVPDATLMVIWNAERFGLSQLHQLRGRVGRGAYAGRCVLVTDAATDDARRRIEAMVASTDGFRLAEIDLEIRGHGTLFGGSQSGAGDLRFGDLLRDRHLIEAAATTASLAVAEDRGGPFVSSFLEEFELFMGGAASWLGKS